MFLVVVGGVLQYVLPNIADIAVYLLIKTLVNRYI